MEVQHSGAASSSEELTSPKAAHTVSMSMHQTVVKLKNGRQRGYSGRGSTMMKGLDLSQIINNDDDDEERPARVTRQSINGRVDALYNADYHPMDEVIKPARKRQDHRQASKRGKRRERSSDVESWAEVIDLQSSCNETESDDDRERAFKPRRGERKSSRIASSQDPRPLYDLKKHPQDADLRHALGGSVIVSKNSRKRKRSNIELDAPSRAADDDTATLQSLLSGHDGTIDISAASRIRAQLDKIIHNSGVESGLKQPTTKQSSSRHKQRSNRSKTTRQPAVATEDYSSNAGETAHKHSTSPKRNIVESSSEAEPPIQRPERVHHNKVSEKVQITGMARAATVVYSDDDCPTSESAVMTTDSPQRNGIVRGGLSAVQDYHQGFSEDDDEHTLVDSSRQTGQTTALLSLPQVSVSIPSTQTRDIFFISDSLPHHEPESAMSRVQLSTVQEEPFIIPSSVPSAGQFRPFEMRRPLTEVRNSNPTRSAPREKSSWSGNGQENRISSGFTSINAQKEARNRAESAMGAMVDQYEDPDGSSDTSHFREAMSDLGHMM